MSDLSFITGEMFSDKLTEIINREPAANLLGIGTIYEDLSEFYNNEVIEELLEEREENE
jgi:hypothetical protein